MRPRHTQVASQRMALATPTDPHQAPNSPFPPSPSDHRPPWGRCRLQLQAHKRAGEGEGSPKVPKRTDPWSQGDSGEGLHPRGLIGPLPGVPTLLCKDLSVLAKTTVAEASHELVIQALVPFRTHESPSARAVVEAAPASLPFPAACTDSESTASTSQRALPPASRVPSVFPSPPQPGS